MIIDPPGPVMPPLTPLPPEAGTSSPQQVLGVYEKYFTALGATNAALHGNNALVVDFPNARSTQVADGVLRDSVNGVQLVLRGAGPDTKPAAPDTASLLAAAGALPGVHRVQDVVPGTVAIWANTETDAGILQGLLNARIGDVRAIVEYDQAIEPRPHSVGGGEG